MRSSRPKDSVVIPIRTWFIGEHKVGKSSFIYKFIMGEFPKYLSPTVGIEESSQMQGDYQFLFKDTAGIKKYQVDLSTQIKNADLVFLCFDLTSIETLVNLEKYYYQNIQIYLPRSTVKILIGLKSDAVKQFDQILYDRVIKFAEKEKLMYIESSIYFNDDFISQEFTFKDLLSSRSRKIEYESESERFFGETKDKNYLDVLQATVKSRDSKAMLMQNGTIEVNESKYGAMDIHYRAGVKVIFEYALSTLTETRRKTEIKENVCYESYRGSSTNRNTTIKLSAEEKSTFCFCKS